MVKVQRKSDVRFNRGAAVIMSDGWRGKIEQDVGGLVVCIADGEKPNENWCGDYRILGRSSSIKVDGNKVTVDWKKPPALASRRKTAREQRQRETVAELQRAALAQEWSSAPYD
jgi:hypothetical protein